VNGSAIAKRYANGFLEYARDTIGFAKGLEELIALRDILRDTLDLETFLESPEIRYTEKYDFIESVFKENFSQEVRQFLKLLLKKGRISSFGEIAEYARIKYAHGEEFAALLNTSYPIDTHLMKDIEEKLEKKLNKKLRFYVDLDPDLLGGVKVTIGNTVIDGSVRRRLEDLKEKLMAVKVS